MRVPRFKQRSLHITEKLAHTEFCLLACGFGKEPITMLETILAVKFNLSLSGGAGAGVMTD